jgi:hypothetical protein
MLSSVFVNAPAGVLGTGSVDARPESCVALRPALLGAVAGVAGTRVRTTGLPSVAERAPGMPPVLRGWSGAGATPAVRTQHDQINNDVTTLGNHSPGRPLS